MPEHVVLNKSKCYSQKNAQNAYFLKQRQIQSLSQKNKNATAKNQRRLSSFSTE